jgi:hypothetical protein
MMGASTSHSNPWSLAHMRLLATSLAAVTLSAVLSAALFAQGQNFVVLEVSRLPIDTSLPGTSTTDVDLVDVDGDGDLDIFKAEGTDSLAGRPNQLLLNDGSGHFVDDCDPWPRVGAKHALELGLPRHPRDIRHSADVEQHSRMIVGTEAERVDQRHQRCALTAGSNVARAEVVDDGTAEPFREDGRLAQLPADQGWLVPYGLPVQRDEIDGGCRHMRRGEQLLDRIGRPFGDGGVKARQLGRVRPIEAALDGGPLRGADPTRERRPDSPRVGP